MIRLQYFGTAGLDAVRKIKVPDMSRNRLELADTVIILPRSITVT